MNVRRFVWEKRLSLKWKTLPYVEYLRKNQWLSANKIERIQQEKLTKLLQHAYRHTTYYQKLFKECGVIDSGGNVRLKRFHAIPFLEKEILQQNFSEMQSNDLAKRSWYLNSTGGSTGVPTRFIQDQEYFSWNQATKTLYDEWTGRFATDKQIRLWGSDQGLLEGKKVKTQFGRWLRNERWFNCLQMTDDQRSRCIRQINTFQPVQILAYVEPLYELARLCEREGHTVFSPKAIMTSAGTLYPHMRDTIERVFRTKVYNRYGSTEVGDMACECEKHEGLHLSAFTHIIEIIRPDGTLTEPGEVGEIVVTLLVNDAMPLIRYRIGDMGAWSKKPCSCGRGLPLLQEVTGRVTDMFIDKKGRWIDGRLFLFALDSKEYVRKFQVIQETQDSIRIPIILADRGINPAQAYQKELEQIKRDIQKVMDCHVTFEFCDHIMSTPSGKYRYTISHAKR
ncbi:MAG: phenylacetate--CoA ligase family protein [Clostridia bacterium]